MASNMAAVFCAVVISNPDLNVIVTHVGNLVVANF